MSKVQKKKASEKELTKRREMKKLSMRRAREKLRQENIDKYEEIKKQDREHKRATRKKVAQMTDREIRQIQKKWRERARRYRQRKKKHNSVHLHLPTAPCLISQLYILHLELIVVERQEGEIESYLIRN